MTDCTVPVYRTLLPKNAVQKKGTLHISFCLSIIFIAAMRPLQKKKDNTLYKVANFQKQTVFRLEETTATNSLLYLLLTIDL